MYARRSTNTSSGSAAVGAGSTEASTSMAAKKRLREETVAQDMPYTAIPGSYQ